MHRISHFLWTHKLSFLARLSSHIGRFLTGGEIKLSSRRALP
jgi:serine O-acetyltransferase